jgi:hypothetical protein
MHDHCMRQGLRALLGAYEITKEPVMTGPGLRWAPYVVLAVAPYRVTAVPRCDVGGLEQALVRARRRRAHAGHERREAALRAEVGLVTS